MTEPWRVDRGASFNVQAATIEWRLLLRVKNRSKADRTIDEVRRLFAREVALTECVRYWKDDSLWDCSFRTAGGRGSPADLVYDCLVLAGRLGNGWFLVGPGGDGALTVFDGVFDVNRSGQAGILGLEWASFCLSVSDREHKSS